MENDHFNLINDAELHTQLQLRVETEVKNW